MNARATVLVVEDNAVTSKLVRVVLEDEGYEVLMAATGAQALEHVARQRPDLILQDLVLPDMTGFELVVRLRQLPGFADVIILAFTGVVSDAEDQRIADAPFDGLLIKPVAPSRLVATIEDFLKRTPRPAGGQRSRAAPSQLPSSGLDPAQRADLQASALGVLGTIADALSRQKDVEVALGEVLAQAVDAAGLSRGAVLLFQPGGALTCLSQVGFDSSVDQLTTVVGPELLAEVRAKGSVLILTPDTASSDIGRQLLVRTGALSALVAPIASGPAEIGILLLSSATRLLTGDEWRGFARAVAAQLGQAIALRRAFESISQSEHRYRHLFETVNLVVLGLDTHGVVDYANPYFLRLTGYTPEEVFGQSWFDFLPATQRTAMQVVFRELVEQGQHSHYQNLVLTKSGDERMIAWHNTVLRGPAGAFSGTLSIGEDITERLHTERQLVQAQKMEVVGQLAGGIAHDFNNLLAAITVFAELVEMDLPKDDAHRADLQEIQQAVARAQRLTRQLLAFSKQQVLQPAVIDPNAVIGELAKMLGRLIGEDIDLKLELSPSVGAILIDPGQLEQVLMNLAVNARDAMPSGGRLTFRTRREGTDVILTVSDTGTGMSDEVRQRIFEPFFTTKAGKGTGLGLATVHGIIQQSGGRVEVRSAPGRGTTFTIALPGTLEEPALKAGAGVEALPRGRETILLVEDDPGVRNAATSVLRRLGYRVLEARSGAEALGIAEEHTDPIHLALTDVVMPGMDGRDFLEHLQTVRPQIKGVLMSGYAGDVIARHGPLSPDIPLISKPFTSRSMAQRIRAILDSTG